MTRLRILLLTILARRLADWTNVVQRRLEAAERRARAEQHRSHSMSEWLPTEGERIEAHVSAEDAEMLTDRVIESDSAPAHWLEYVRSRQAQMIESAQQPIAPDPTEPQTDASRVKGEQLDTD